MASSAMTPERTRRILLSELREKLIPWAQQTGLDRFVLAQPPIRLPESVSLSYHPGAPLEEVQSERAQDRLQVWPQDHMLSSRSPRLCCVFKGEIDWRIGITQRMAEELEGDASECDYHVLSLPAGTFFLMPPGVPYATGTRAHWERAEAVQEEALIFWLQILPYGVFCHYCRSACSAHAGYPSIYLPGTAPGELVKDLIEILEARDKGFERAGKTVLVSLLKAVERVLAAQRIPQAQFVTALLGTEPLDATIPTDVGRVVRVACEFIYINLHHPITLNQIAEHAGVSATHLNRLFHAELGRSAMQLVRERRIHTAKALLRDSELMVQNVGEMIGYPNPSHFTRIFLQMEKVSPLRYRTAARSERDRP